MIYEASGDCDVPTNYSINMVMLAILGGLSLVYIYHCVSLSLHVVVEVVLRHQSEAEEGVTDMIVLSLTSNSIRPSPFLSRKWQDR